MDTIAVGNSTSARSTDQLETILEGRWYEILLLLVIPLGATAYVHGSNIVFLGQAIHKLVAGEPKDATNITVPSADWSGPAAEAVPTGCCVHGQVNECETKLTNNAV